MKRVTIVGLGLIGGSIARALREHTEIQVIAIDRAEVGEVPGVKSVVSEFVATDQVASSKALIDASDLIVLCQPVRVIASTAATYLAKGTAMTDTGSTKRVIAEQISQLSDAEWFVPSHPMAGKAQGGFENAAADLFRERNWIICPERSHPEALAKVERLIELVGALPVYMSPEEHDTAVAVVSHLPQLLASWLRLTGSERNALKAAGPAFREMTRTAGGAESMWQDIFETNADEVGELLKDASFALAAASDALLAKPPRVEAVLELLRRARAARQT